MSRTWLFGLATLLWSGPVLALDADTFKLSGSGYDSQGTLQVVAPTIGYPNAMYGGLGLVWAKNPVVLLKSDGTEETLVSSQFSTRLGVGYSILGKTRLDVELPFYPSVQGSSAIPAGATMGDMRLQAVVPIAYDEDAAFHFAMAPALTFPTGNPDLFTGTAKSVSFDLVASGGVTAGSFGINGNVGVNLGGKEQAYDLDFGSAFGVAAGAFYGFSEAFRAGLELDSELTVAGGLGPYNKNPTEGHIYGQYGTKSGLVATAGLGTGLVAGVGAPDLRTFILLGYHTEGTQPIFDIDNDGILDEVDKCVEQPEDIDNFEDEDGCPDPDNDRDGISDKQDGCPLQPEDLDGFKDGDGCPDPDNDGDRVLDVDDACPTEAGTVATRGCPDQDGDGVVDSEDQCVNQAGPVEAKGCPDRDHDKVPDSRDRCPDEAADPRVDPARSDGCPARVFVTKEKIEILEKVFFDTNKTTIKPASFGLLDDVARVLNENPDIRNVEVAGHTDNVGNDAANLKLSQGRAEAVMKYLVNKGKVDLNRLTAVGYGETRAIDTNDTTAGQANNRRVEFVIKQAQ